MTNETPRGNPDAVNPHVRFFCGRLGWKLAGIRTFILSSASCAMLSCLAESRPMDFAQYWTPQTEDTWVGDVVLGRFRGRLHVFYLKDRHHHMSAEGMGLHQFAHLSAKDDLTDWQEHPDALPLTEWWQTQGTGTPFVKDGKLCLAYGFHTERVENWKELGLPAGATWAESEDGIHFKPSGVFFHETRNPTVFNRPDGTFGLVLGYQDMGGLYVSKDLLNWKVAETGFPGRGDCPCYFEWNGHRYLLQGFTQMYHAKVGQEGAWEDWAKKGTTVYDGLGVPMVCEMANGRRILAGWLGHPVGWGGWLVFRELVQEPDGRLGTKWPAGLPTPVSSPAVYRFAAGEKAVISYQSVRGHKRLSLTVDPQTRTARWNSDKFEVREIDGLDRDYVVRFAAWYDARHDVTIFDAEIAGRRTIITRRYGTYEPVLETTDVH